MTEWLVVPASSFATDIDFIFTLIFVICAFWYTLSNLAFFWFLFRYRKQPGVAAQYITGNEHHLKKWIEWPHYAIILCDVAIIVCAVQVWYAVKQDLPTPDSEIGVMSQQWAWSFVQPGADGPASTWLVYSLFVRPASYLPVGPVVQENVRVQTIENLRAVAAHAEERHRAAAAQ